MGLSAPYNSVFTLFGQFFDHGLDLVDQGGNGTVYMPLKPDDPLYDDSPGARTNFMALTRALNQPGPDGQMGTADDVQEATNTTATFVDQSQTYTSHPSHQVFLREYANCAAGKPVSTGQDARGPRRRHGDLGDVKEQAATLLGIQLRDTDVLRRPAAGHRPVRPVHPRPTTGVPADRHPARGQPCGQRHAGVHRSRRRTRCRTGHAFLDDIAHHAQPRGDRQPRRRPRPGR